MPILTNTYVNRYKNLNMFCKIDLYFFTCVYFIKHNIENHNIMDPDLENILLPSPIQYNPTLPDLPTNISTQLNFFRENETASLPQSNTKGIVDINDIRSPGDFKGFSFSRYKKADVRAQFIDSIHKGKIEPACYWCAELVCAGHYGDIWEMITYYMAKHIHLGNPKLPIYIEMRYNVFRNIMLNNILPTELGLRNDEKMRKLFAEIICTLALSNKKPSFEPIKINRLEEFDMTQMTDRLKAPDMSFAAPIFQSKDPKELFIAVNEFAYCVSDRQNANMMKACYWIEWVIEFDNVCRKRKEICKCERRVRYQVEPKFQMDIIWLFWDTLIHYCELLKNPLLEKCLSAIQRLFCIKYTTAACKKRRYMLYYAVGLLTEPVSLNVEILPNKQVLKTVIDKIGEVYKQIKKNEEAPKTEYLFRGLEKERALERSIAQMNIVNQMDPQRK